MKSSRLSFHNTGFIIFTISALILLSNCAMQEEHGMEMKHDTMATEKSMEGSMMKEEMPMKKMDTEMKSDKTMSTMQ